MLIVFGSINMDMVFRLDKLPGPGETVVSTAYDMTPGGKGANQALAAARSGAKTALVGMRGNDATGKNMTVALRRDGVMTTGVGEGRQPTGYAVFNIDKDGKRQAVFAPGANAETKADQVPNEILTPGNFVLMQMEVPVRECAILLERAKSRGVTTMLNLAPALNITPQMLDNLDYLIVNQDEARQLAKMLGIDVDHDATKLAHAFAKKGKLTCIVTLGKDGSYGVTVDGKEVRVPTLHLEKETDRTGAGDAYCGTLAACLHGGMSLNNAIRRAAVAGALTCTGFGAQPSFPYLADIETHLGELGESH